MHKTFAMQNQNADKIIQSHDKEIIHCERIKNILKHIKI